MYQLIKKILCITLLFICIGLITGCKNPVVEKRNPLNQVGTKWKSVDNSVYFEVNDMDEANGIIFTINGERIQCILSRDMGTKLFLNTPTVWDDHAFSDEECYEEWECYFLSEDKFVVNEIVKTTFFSPNMNLVFEKIN